MGSIQRSYGTKHIIEHSVNYVIEISDNDSAYYKKLQLRDCVEGAFLIV